jgi:hypothetical protein
MSKVRRDTADMNPSQEGCIVSLPPPAGRVAFEDGLVILGIAPYQRIR